MPQTPGKTTYRFCSNRITCIKDYVLYSIKTRVICRSIKKKIPCSTWLCHENFSDPLCDFVRWYRLYQVFVHMPSRPAFCKVVNNCPIVRLTFPWSLGQSSINLNNDIICSQRFWMYNYKDAVYISVNVVDFILISPFHAIKNGTFPCDRTNM